MKTYPLDEEVKIRRRETLKYYSLEIS